MSEWGQYDMVLRDGGIWERLYRPVSAGLPMLKALEAAGLPDRPGWRELYFWVREDAYDDEDLYPVLVEGDA